MRFAVARRGVAALSRGYAATGAAVNQKTDKIFEVTNESELVHMINDVNTPGTVVVDCYADWCGPCKKLTPLLEAEVNKAPSVRLAKLNVDNHSNFPEKYRVNAIPAVFAFHKGLKIAHFVGLPTPENLSVWVQNCNSPESILNEEANLDRRN